MNYSLYVLIYNGINCYQPRVFLRCLVFVVNGGWSSWSGWSSCSSTCGPGLSQRQGSCSNPVPALNGRDCNGDSTDKQLCETKTCAGKENKVMKG